MRQFVLLHVALTAGAVTVSQRSSSSALANPIRKVVKLLEAMQEKVSEEGKRADELFKKFMCYCEKSGGDLAASIAAAEARGPEIKASIESGEGRKAQLESDLDSHQKDRDAAKTAIAEANAIREKDKATYDKDLGDSNANTAALQKAIAAISKGMGASFVQTSIAATLRNLVSNRQNMMDGDRQTLLSFLSGQTGGEYAPASGEIVGILKQMLDEMLADKADMVAKEEAAVKSHEELVSAKSKEIEALTAGIEDKLNRVGELGVEIANLKNEAGDSAQSLEEDKKFAADLQANCAQKSGIQDQEKKARAEELVALAETIKILNDDDALELFKKTLPSPATSFVQLQETNKAWRARAHAVLSTSRGVFKAGQDAHRLDLILLALHGRKVGFEQIVKLIDELVATLQKEQQDDDQKKEYCATQADQAEDKQKELDRSLSDVTTLMAKIQEDLAKVTEEMAALSAGITELDSSVTKATEQRKAENAEYKDLMSSNTAAKDLILLAKNRLNKFYNPALYKEAPKKELSAEDRVYQNMGGEITTQAPGGIANTGIKAFMQVAPPPAPETAAAYTKKSEESNGVMKMMDLLVADLDKEMTVAETEEKNAQKEYEQMTADAAEKRKRDAESLTDKEGAKAGLEGTLEESKGKQGTLQHEIMENQKFTAALHAECDWLVQNFDARKEARTNEIDSLGKAKAVLNGADFSFVQVTRHLRHG